MRCEACGRSNSESEKSIEVVRPAGKTEDCTLSSKTLVLGVPSVDAELMVAIDEAISSACAERGANSIAKITAALNLSSISIPDAYNSREIISIQAKLANFANNVKRYGVVA